MLAGSEVGDLKGGFAVNDHGCCGIHKGSDKLSYDVCESAYLHSGKTLDPET